MLHLLLSVITDLFGHEAKGFESKNFLHLEVPYPRGLRERIANPRFPGSNPGGTSTPFPRHSQNSRCEKKNSQCVFRHFEPKAKDLMEFLRCAQDDDVAQDDDSQLR